MKILGHRGDGVSNLTPDLRAARLEQGKLPENTIEAFRKVLDEGADGVEFDIHISADGKAMVIHDDALEKHVVSGSGLVSKMKCEELKELDVGGGFKIPTLEETIEACGKKAILNIELKGGNSAAVVVEIVNKYVAKGWDKSNFIVSAFKNTLLNEVREMDVEIQIGLLFESGQLLSNVPKLVQEYKPFSLHPNISDVTEELLVTAKDNGLKVIAWTSGEPLIKQNEEWVLEQGWVNRLVSFYKKGYDLWVITDNPTVLRKALKL